MSVLDTFTNWLDTGKKVVDTATDVKKRVNNWDGSEKTTSNDISSEEQPKTNYIPFAILAGLAFLVLRKK